MTSRYAGVARERPGRVRRRGRVCRRGRPVTAAVALIASAVALAGLSGAAGAAMPAGADLVRDLRAGGYVLVMRHAQSPDARPDGSDAEPDNAAHERQLSAAGKAQARALGAALRKLAIPIGRIYSSPTYRARETIRLAGLGAPQVVTQLDEGSRGMRGSAGRAQLAWLRQAAAEAPPTGTDTLIVTHTPNIAGAFGRSSADVQAGEMILFKPAKGGAAASVVARITIAQWRQWASRAAR